MLSRTLLWCLFSIILFCEGLHHVKRIKSPCFQEPFTINPFMKCIQSQQNNLLKMQQSLNFPLNYFQTQDFFQRIVALPTHAPHRQVSVNNNPWSNLLLNFVNRPINTLPINNVLLFRPHITSPGAGSFATSSTNRLPEIFSVNPNYSSDHNSDYSHGMTDKPLPSDFIKSLDVINDTSNKKEDIVKATMEKTTMETLVEQIHFNLSEKSTEKNTDEEHLNKKDYSEKSTNTSNLISVQDKTFVTENIPDSFKLSTTPSNINKSSLVYNEEFVDNISEGPYENDSRFNVILNFEEGNNNSEFSNLRTPTDAIPVINSVPESAEKNQVSIGIDATVYTTDTPESILLFNSTNDSVKNIIYPTEFLATDEYITYTTYMTPQHEKYASLNNTEPEVSDYHKSPPSSYIKTSQNLNYGSENSTNINLTHEREMEKYTANDEDKQNEFPSTTYVYDQDSSKRVTNIIETNTFLNVNELITESYISSVNNELKLEDYEIYPSYESNEDMKHSIKSEVSEYSEFLSTSTEEGKISFYTTIAPENKLYDLSMNKSLNFSVEPDDIGYVQHHETEIDISFEDEELVDNQSVTSSSKDQYLKGMPVDEKPIDSAVELDPELSDLENSTIKYEIDFRFDHNTDDETKENFNYNSLLMDISHNAQNSGNNETEGTLTSNKYDNIEDYKNNSFLLEYLQKNGLNASTELDSSNRKDVANINNSNKNLTEKVFQFFNEVTTEIYNPENEEPVTTLQYNTLQRNVNNTKNGFINNDNSSLPVTENNLFDSYATDIETTTVNKKLVPNVYNTEFHDIKPVFEEIDDIPEKLNIVTTTLKLGINNYGKNLTSAPVSETVQHEKQFFGSNETTEELNIFGNFKNTSEVLDNRKHLNQNLRLNISTPKSDSIANTSSENNFIENENSNSKEINFIPSFTSTTEYPSIKSYQPFYDVFVNKLHTTGFISEGKGMKDNTPKLDNYEESSVNITTNSTTSLPSVLDQSDVLIITEDLDNIEMSKENKEINLTNNNPDTYGVIDNNVQKEGNTVNLFSGEYTYEDPFSDYFEPIAVPINKHDFEKEKHLSNSMTDSVTHEESAYIIREKRSSTSFLSLKKLLYVVNNSSKLDNYTQLFSKHLSLIYNRKQTLNDNLQKLTNISQIIKRSHNKIENKHKSSNSQNLSKYIKKVVAEIKRLVNETKSDGLIKQRKNNFTSNKLRKKRTSNLKRQNLSVEKEKNEPKSLKQSDVAAMLALLKQNEAKNNFQADEAYVGDDQYSYEYDYEDGEDLKLADGNHDDDEEEKNFGSDYYEDGSSILELISTNITRKYTKDHNGNT